MSNVERLNIAGFLAKTFIVSKITPLIIISCLIVGLISTLIMPREENPQISAPGAVVQVNFPGASPSEVEQLVINPLEAIISEINGIEDTMAMADNSVGLVMVQFETGMDKEEAAVKLFRQLASEGHRLPKGSSEPFIRSLDVDEVPILTLTLASEQYSDYALKRLADRIQERLLSLDEVSVVSIYGGVDREIRVELDPERLAAIGIAADRLRQMLLASNVSMPVLEQVIRGRRQEIIIDGTITSAQQLSKVIIGIHQSRPVYLSDVATIIDGPAVERENLSRFAFGQADPRYGQGKISEMPAVTIGVAKKLGTNAVLVARDVEARLEKMKMTMVPEGVYMEITRNDGTKANNAVNDIIKNLGVSVIAVFLVIAIFMGFREALIVAISVPLVVAVTLVIDYLFGLTINRITLFAFIFSMGMIVDASIVVLENISRHTKNNTLADRKQLIILATNEIGNPTNLATFAIILVFFALFILTGMVGQYFYPIAFTVPVAMGCSLILAYIVTPWACYRWMNTGGNSGDPSFQQQGEQRMLASLDRIMTPLLLSARRRWLLIGLLSVCLVVATLQGSWQFFRPQGPGGEMSPGTVSLAMLPKDNKNTFVMLVKMPSDAILETTDQLTRELGDLLATIPHITNYQSYLGSAGAPDLNTLLRGASVNRGPQYAEIRVNLTDKHDRKTSSIEIVRSLRPAVEVIQAKYPGAQIELVEDPPGPPLRATIVAEIYGPDNEGLRQVTEEVTEEFKKTYDLIEIYNSNATPVEQARVVIDQEKAALSGISAAEIANLLYRLTEGDVLGYAHVDGEKNQVPIKLKVPRRFMIKPNSLDRVLMTNSAGDNVPLSEMVTVEYAIAEPPIFHKNTEKVSYVDAELFDSAPVYAVLDLDSRLDGKMTSMGKLQTANLGLNPDPPSILDGYQLLWEGELRMTLDMFRDMLVALVIALVLIYLLLVAYYSSFIIPLLAMVSILPGFIGVIWGHWMLGAPFTGASMIGAIALSGVVVRNALLIIDFILEHLKQGDSLMLACRQAGAIRLIPILFTAISTVLGAAPMLSDPVFSGLAISLIFGTLLSTVVTVILVPVLYFQWASRHDQERVEMA